MTDTDPNAWRAGIKVHPVANAFPMLTAAELSDLAADIMAHGLQTPVVWIETPDGRALLDGRNRAAAVWRIPDAVRRMELQTQMRDGGTVLPADANAVDVVRSLNLHRRHLQMTLKERRELATALLKEDWNRSNRAVAKLVGDLDHKTVGAIRDDLEETGEIPSSKRAVGLDGKAHPIRRPGEIRTSRPPVIELARSPDNPDLFADLVRSHTEPAKPAKPRQPTVTEPVDPLAPAAAAPPAELTLADAIITLERQIDVDHKAIIPALQTLLGKCIARDAERTIAGAVVPVLSQHRDHLAKQLAPLTRTALTRAADIHRHPGLLAREAGKLRKDRLDPALSR